ncbi:MAG: hypothetical protein RBS07_13035 [Lentimicrobium sp.]|nr:hypothetical protein [Lentimicrobium sp.]
MRLLLTIILVLVFSFSCSKSPKCWGENQNKGIIEESIRIDCELTIKQQEFIIADDSTFEQVFTNSLSGQLNCTLPIIDFNNNSLLGLFTTGSCEVKYIREVTRNESEENYHYKVVVKSCGTCKKEGYAYNWVTVPKIPENWNVTFEIENK